MQTHAIVFYANNSQNFYRYIDLIRRQLNEYRAVY